MKHDLISKESKSIQYFKPALVSFVFIIFFVSANAISSRFQKPFTGFPVDVDTIRFFKSISVGRANKIIYEYLENPQFVILDVRKTDDYSKEHINKAINIDFKSSDFSIRLDSLDKSKIYLVHCYGGYRSKITLQMMEGKHFTKVYNMKGGIMKWRAKKLPLVSQ